MARCEDTIRDIDQYAQLHPPGGLPPPTNTQSTMERSEHRGTPIGISRGNSICAGSALPTPAHPPLRQNLVPVTPLQGLPFRFIHTGLDPVRLPPLSVVHCPSSPDRK